ncbi:hypothetical protein GGF31_000707 [Allomyces arbusculus]|nr:hypothetical protein GGF31_000707 [Allomyces arbusculus]
MTSVNPLTITAALLLAIATVVATMVTPALAAPAKCTSLAPVAPTATQTSAATISTSAPAATTPTSAPAATISKSTPAATIPTSAPVATIPTSVPSATIPKSAPAATRTPTAPAAPPAQWKTITKNGIGTDSGMWYSLWTDSPGHASLIVGPDGQYKTTWNEVGDVVAGKGWPTGSFTRVVGYSGTFSPQGSGFLSLYGWTKDWTVEYAISDNWGNYRPTGEFRGTLFSDGDTYDIYQVFRKDASPSGGKFQNYMSVRRNKRSSGTITFANHVKAWASHGMPLGPLGVQFLATEGYKSSGSSSINVWEVHP